MRIDWTYDGCDEHDVPEIERYWAKVQIELDGKLAELSDAPSELRLAVERTEDNPLWEIQAALHLPGLTLVADGTGERPEPALDTILHSLAQQIDEQESIPTRITQRRAGLTGVEQLLEGWHAEDRSQAFLSFLNPLVSSLWSYVQHELSVREGEATLIGEELDVADVLDEVLLQAWEQFSQRDRKLPLDLWLVGLADAALDRLSQQVAEVSIDDETPTGDSRPDEPEAWIEQVGYPETIEFSELLSDGPGVASWDDLDLETRQAHLAELLGSLDRDQRQAFVLSAAHGFDPAEIADFQSRSRASVEEDIAEVTESIRQRIRVEQQAAVLVARRPIAPVRNSTILIVRTQGCRFISYPTPSPLNMGGRFIQSVGSLE